MTGANTGSDNIDITYNHGATGHSTSTYDGHTITGPMPQQATATGSGGPHTACPSALPKEPAVQATVTRLRHGTYKVKVTVSIAGMGANEAAIDTQPVYDATIHAGRANVHTNAKGIAIVTTRKARRVRITASDTLQPTTAYLGPRHLTRKLGHRPSPDNGADAPPRRS